MSLTLSWLFTCLIAAVVYTLWAFLVWDLQWINGMAEWTFVGRAGFLLYQVAIPVYCGAWCFFNLEENKK